MVQAARKKAAAGKTVSKSLAKWSPKGKGKGSWPVDIIGTLLCDDIIKYLAPTLKKHNGCTIIDIYPGASVFSSKLHDFLQPDTHFLVEPDKSFFNPFIKPLLDAPGSTYRHVAVEGTNLMQQWYRFRSTYNEKIGTKLTTQANSFNQFNPNILVVGNVSRLCKPGTQWEIHLPLGIGLLRQFSSDLLAREFFHKDGPVRVLCWVPEKYKPSLFPPNHMSGQSQLNATIDLAYDMTEVAGIRSGADIRDERRMRRIERKRSGKLFEASRDAVAFRMKNLRMAQPPDRPFQDVFESSYEEASKSDYISPMSGVWKNKRVLTAQLKRAEKRMASVSSWCGLPFQHLNLQSQDQEALKAMAAAIASIHYPQAALAPKYFPHSKKISVHIKSFSVLADMALRTINLEAGFATLRHRFTEQEREDIRTRIKTLNSTIMSLRGNKEMTVLLEDFLEEQITFYSSSPVATWDRRAYEPLQAHISDFAPQDTGLTLLDMSPRPVDLAVPDLASGREVTELCTHMLKSLFSSRRSPLPSALDKTLGVNAGRDLVPMVPEITDVRKGGRLDPQDVKVRMLTPGMIEGIAKAFFEWPFKPENWQASLSQAGVEAEAEAKAGKEKTEEEGVDEEV